MNFKESHEFSKEFKRLSKKYKTLEQDLNNFKKTIPFIDFKANKNFAVLHEENNIFILKARFFCRYLRKNTLRLIFIKNKDNIEFIEIYFKGDKPNENRERIKKHLTNIFK